MPQHLRATEFDQHGSNWAAPAEDRFKPRCAEPDRPAPVSNVRSHTHWAMGGFLLGVTFWYCVGIVDFVHKVILAPQDATLATASAVGNGTFTSRSGLGGKTSSRLAGVVDTNHTSGCVTLAVHVRKSTTDVTGCPRPVIAMHTPESPQVVQAVTD